MAKKPIKMSKDVKNFILQKMAEGHDISEICERWHDKVPNRSYIYHKGITDEEFAKDLDRAYSILLMHRLDDLHRLASRTADEEYPTKDWRMAEATMRRRMDEAKFVLSKMAPVLSNRFNRPQQVDVKHENAGPQVVIMNYSTPELLPPIDITPESVKLEDKQ